LNTMSKRDLKKYLASLPKEELEEQLLSLYEKFGEVKAYYDFVFNPKEDKLEQEAKVKIANEYFPIKGKRPKLRRSTAQKYSGKRELSYASFYKSILNSYKQVVEYVTVNGMAPNFSERIATIKNEAFRQYWENRKEFERIHDNFE